METKYFVGEIDLPNGKIRKELIKGYRINDDVHDAIERKVKNLQLDIDNFKTNIDKSFWLPFRPIGSFLVRYATTQEILENHLKDFAGGWDEYNIQGFAEEIVETVLETIPRDALIEELERRKEEGDDN